MKKVILYALGEILLVVIGILIAVQLNNWNTQRKLEQTERIALSRLHEDLKSDQQRYAFLGGRLTERIGRCDSALTLLENQRTFQDRLDLIQIHQINFFLVESNTTTYEEMLNTGRLYSLKDKKLRSRIIRYYKDVEKWSKYIEKDNGQLRSRVGQPELNDYWIVQRKIWDGKTIDNRKFPWLNLVNSEEIKDIEALLQITRTTYNTHLRSILYLKEENEKLLAILEDYAPDQGDIDS